MSPEERIQTEKHIKSYLKKYNVGKILYMQVEQTFSDLGNIVNVWNVKTNKKAWWIVEGENAPMNLYPQDAYYFSADEAYSFHMGITQRLQKDYQKNFTHVLDEIPLDIERIKSIKRKLLEASQQLSNAIESEHFQSIGLICRESLIELGKELAKRNKKIIKEKNLKLSDFKGISNAFIDHYIPGKNNDNLRNHARKITETGWSYSSEIVHSSSKNYPDVKILILLTSTIVSLFENLFLKYLGFDAELKCKKCQSRDLELFENEVNDTVLVVCNKCSYGEPVNLHTNAVSE